MEGEDEPSEDDQFASESGGAEDSSEAAAQERCVRRRRWRRLQQLCCMDAGVVVPMTLPYELCYERQVAAAVVAARLSGQRSTLAQAMAEFELIRRNRYHRKLVTLEADDIPACGCDATPRQVAEGEAGCDPGDCDNALMFQECDPNVCKWGKLCQNQRFARRQYSPIKIKVRKIVWCALFVLFLSLTLSSPVG